MTKTELVLTTLYNVLGAALADRLADRNEAVPIEAPETGLVIMRDGDPGQPAGVLGGIKSDEYSHQIELELYVQHRKAVERDRIFDELVEAVKQPILADVTLGGQVADIVIQPPVTNTRPPDEAPPIKEGIITLVVTYFDED